MPARVRREVPVWLIATAFVVCLPLIIPAAIAWQALERRRRQRAVQRFACERCGRILGSAALRLGDAAWDKELREILDRLPPHVRVRIVRRVDAVCARCGARYMWAEGLRTFRPSPRDQADAAADAARRNHGDDGDE